MSLSLVLLLAIDAGPYHRLMAHDVLPPLMPALRDLIERGLVRRVIRAGKPPWYVLTNHALHAIGTFRSDCFEQSLREYRRSRRKRAA